MINVTRSYLPDLEIYTGYLRQIWDSGQMTNGGAMATSLERQLEDYLGVQHVVLVSNATLGLQLAIKALGLEGSVITTPFSYVATLTSLLWQGCSPVFADIDRRTLCLDPRSAREKANRIPELGGILATHVYGNPCNLEEFEQLAADQNCPLIFDAAHAFGVTFDGVSILGRGDASVLSFHATKLFHTAEGGAVVTNNETIAHKVRQLRNFGHTSPETFDRVGINGKMSELQAALGLAILPNMAGQIRLRERVSATYDEILRNLVERPTPSPGTGCNFAYYPILFPSETLRERAISVLQTEGIFPRRYFSPSLNTLPYVKYHHMPNSEDAAKRILCLPLFADLELEEAHRIGELVAKIC